MKIITMYHKPKPNRFVIITLFICIIILFTGCYSAKKAQQDVDKADSHYPEIVAKLARDKYPCTDLLKPDTAVVFVDSLIYIDCPAVITSYETIRVDTVNNVVTKTVRVPVNMPVQIRTVTKWYEDSAKLKIYDVALDNAVAANKKLTEDNKILQAKVTRRGWENWIWRAIACILIGIKLIGIWNKLTTIKVKSI